MNVLSTAGYISAAIISESYEVVIFLHTVFIHDFYRDLQ